MRILKHLKKEEQELMPLFNGAFIENKPIPFPNHGKTTAYSNLFYWAHLEAKETAEFPLHPHEGFEIMTFIFEGSLEHFDTATKVWTPLKRGDVQVIQAGSGVKHAERIVKGSKLFQIWFDPDFSKSLLHNARYRDYKADIFTMGSKDGTQRLSYVGENSPINSQTQDLEISKSIYERGSYVQDHDKTYTYSYYLLSGEMKINEILLEKDGFLVQSDKEDIHLEVFERSELFMIKSPSEVLYKRFMQRYSD